MKVFITGGSGFIGAPTVRELKKRGYKLAVLSRGVRKEPGILYIKGNLSDIEKWKSKLKKFKPDVGVHLAWEGIPDFSYEMCLKNLEGGLALFNTLAEVGCKKIVTTGTGFEWGNNVGKIPDDVRVESVSAIVAAKHSLRMMGEVLAKTKGIDFIWLRPFNPYGPGQRTGSLIPQIINSADKGIALRLRKPLTQGDFVYVDDVARAIALSVVRGKGIATYNIGSGKLTSVRDIANLICKEMNTGGAYYKEFRETARGTLVPAPYADVSRIKKDIGWHPKIDLKTGIRKTISRYKQNLP